MKKFDEEGFRLAHPNVYKYWLKEDWLKDDSARTSNEVELLVTQHQDMKRTLVLIERLGNCEAFTVNAAAILASECLKKLI